MEYMYLQFSRDLGVTANYWISSLLLNRKTAQSLLKSYKYKLSYYLSSMKSKLTQNNKLLKRTSIISIYTLSDLGDLSNLIGSLSRTIQQYSPPSEWIRKGNSSNF